MSALFADIRYAFRVLLRNPSFALAAVAILALGVGANSAIFSIVNAVLLRPLPYHQPDRLVRLFHVPPQSTFPGMRQFSVSPANFFDWKRDAASFEEMAIYAFRQFTITGGSQPESIVAGAVGADFFEVVQAQPALGRVFRADELSPDRSRVAILSHGFWQSHFGGAPNAVGSTLTLNGDVFTIVGVMPARFSISSWGIAARPLWIPLAFTDEERAVRDNHNDSVVARLRPGVDAARADSEMTVISTRLEREYPQTNAGWGATVVPLQELIVGDMRTTLLMLSAAVGLVLLIACANVGNLLFTRALDRRKEIAIRSALGAGRGRVFQQLLIEALVLATAGGALGLAVARGSLAAGASLLASQVPRADEITMDGRVLAFVLIISALTGLLAGVMPAVRAGRADLTTALKEGGRSDSALGIRTRRLLITGEVALSVVLLMGAAVMIRSLVSLRTTDAGFNPSGVMTMRVSLPESRYATPERMRSFFVNALEQLRALPGVEAAGGVDDLPAQGGSVQPVVLEGKAELLPRDQPTAAVRKITPGYLRAMRIPLLRGRDVAEGDTDAVLVSRAAATLLWGDTDPIGRHITLPLESKSIPRQVVGIVGDVKQGELSDLAGPTVYEYTTAVPVGSLVLVLRTAGAPTGLTRPAAAIVRAIDPNQPVEEIRTMEDVIDETLAAPRFGALLLGVFAAVALTLAAVGIYSVLSYIVRGRSREIGIRTALGARTSDVLGLVVREGMTPAGMGIAAGTVAALGSARLLDRLVYGVSASDPLTLALVAGTLAFVALVATLVPAYRAARLDPLQVLRSN
jgi:putative ABC transport system permease protein